ncbi:MAG TPA: hypothetical protein VL400_19070, partial [Polyangiaceae bacterium]|nr:hypothetical protein [Polyangiaceae bacterium]
TEGGPDGARAFLRRVKREIASVMLLTGSRTVRELGNADRVLGEPLRRWEELTQRSVSSKKKQKARRRG